MKTYYENVNKLMKLRELSVPSKADLQKVFEIIKDDSELTLYFYDELNSGWVELLDEAGEFEELRKSQTSMIGKYKVHYLKQIADIKAETVLGIIENIQAQDINIQGVLIKAIVAMPVAVSIKGISVVLKYLEGQENKIWFFIGVTAGDLMVKLAENYPDKSFEIAESLLDAWVTEKKTFGKDIVAKFSEHDYKELMLGYYKKVWEANPNRAIRILINILNRCIEDWNEKEDISISFGYGLELGDLDNIDLQHPGVKTVLVKGICDAGKVLIEKEPEKIGELLDLLENVKKIIFIRIVMYLLRFVPKGVECDRINYLIGNKDYFKEYNPCWNEHRRLFNDKFYCIGKDTKTEFLKWIQEDKYNDERRKEIESWCNDNKKPLPDFTKMENRAKAEELYLVREKFKEEFERYKNAANVKIDSELAPRKMVSESRIVSPMEGTPLISEEMAKMKCEDVIDYLLEPANYNNKKRTSGWGTAKDALSETFKYDIKKRAKDYLSCRTEKLLKLDLDFLSRLFYGLREAEKPERKIWEQIIDLAHKVVIQKGINEEYRTCYSAILSLLYEGFSNKEDEGIEFTEDKVKKFWEIIKLLVGYPVGDMSRFGDDAKDPMQIRCNLVPGQAMELSVSLGIVCKNRFPDFYNNYLRNEIRECYKKVLEIKELGVKCTFGSDFARIHWMDGEWVKNNLNNLFCDDNWDEIWGTYVSWGSPSPKCFELLIEQGKYLQAIEKIGSGNSKLSFGKLPEEGLVEHLVIGYFNGWIGYENKTLQKFLDKASVELRAKAARFMTTGFKSTKEGNDDKYRLDVTQRMRKYWNNRIDAIKKKPEENIEESTELTAWVCDSLLPAEETLKLLEKTLNLSKGKVGKMRGVRDFVKGVTTLGQSNELLALHCLQKAANEEEMHEPWSSIQDPLVSLLTTMVNKTKEIRDIAADVADMYGRYNPDKFREVWEKFKNLQSL